MLVNIIKLIVMAYLINKDKVETILRNLWKKDDGHNSEHRIYYNKALQEVQCEIDTLEVKEVDLNEEIEKCMKRHNMIAVGRKDFTDIAKHFFELGLKMQKGV